MNAKYTRSPMSFGSGLLVLLMFLWMQCATVHAQAITNDNNIGFPENAIFHGGDIETVQVTNGNLHIEDTIWSAKGRGLDTGYKLLYNNKTWRVDIDCSDYDGVCFGSADGGTAVGVVGPFDWDE